MECEFSRYELSLLETAVRHEYDHVINEAYTKHKDLTYEYWYLNKKLESYLSTYQIPRSEFYIF